MENMELTLGEYLIHELFRHGVRHIFGIPGDYVLGFYKQLEESRIEVINTCDEQGAGFAADAYARIRGLGAVCVTYGVGGLKIANTTAQAFAEESPVVIISGAPGVREQRDDPMLHHKIKSFDTQLKVFEHLTVASAVLNNPQTACREIDRVLSAAICYRRPVYLELPRDVTFEKVNPLHTPLKAPEMDRRPLHEALAEAEIMINAAQRPVIITGVELLRYGMQKILLEFVERTNIPVAATVLSKSAMPEEHCGYLGVYEGAMSREEVRQYVESSDCVMLLGTFLTDLNLGIFTANLEQGVTIHSTSEKTSIRYHTYRGVYLGSFLRGLLKAKIQPREKRVVSQAAMPRAFHLEPQREVTVERVFHYLESVLDESMCILADPGDALFAATEMNLPRASEFMASAYYASLGFAVPATIGVQLALPELRPLVLVGDGAFQMTGIELTTSARYHLNPIVIVLNNYGYGTERPMLDGAFNDVYPWNYSQLPQLLNAGRGFDIQTEGEFELAFRTARSETRFFSLLVVHLAQDDTSPALQRLTETLGKRVK